MRFEQPVGRPEGHSFVTVIELFPFEIIEPYESAVRVFRVKCLSVHNPFTYSCIRFPSMNGR